MLWLLSAVIGNQAAPASQHIADARVPEHACGSNTLGGWGDMTQSRPAWYIIVLRRLRRQGHCGMQVPTVACRASGREAGLRPGPGHGPGPGPGTGLARTRPGVGRAGPARSEPNARPPDGVPSHPRATLANCRAGQP
jgi:hypothetical protein